MPLRKRITSIKYFLAAFIGILIYCEWFVHYIQPFYWVDLQCKNDDCTKVLFIADPQIQGDVATPMPCNYLFSWDSDRYLKSTFSVVVKHFKPDVLVYLGDLMDEGSISTEPQFHGYVKRLSHIFELNYFVIQVWVPGDNDIGGENEPVRESKVLAFSKIFEQSDIITFKNISFYKVNGITNSFPEETETEKYQNEKNVRIVVSHYPITSKYGFGPKVNKAIRPNIYFCAHDHESKYVKQNHELRDRETSWLHKHDKTILEFDLSEGAKHLYEVFVPTCSYRMGTSNIGYGAAVIENDKRMRYAVFWSSTRFPYLLFYLTVLFIFMLYLLSLCAVKICSQKWNIVHNVLLFHRRTWTLGRNESKLLLDKV